MSIYAEKGQDGQPTGTFRVEYQFGKKPNGKPNRLRGTASTIEEARAMQVDFKAKLMGLPGAYVEPVQAARPAQATRVAPGSPSTLVELLEAAKKPLWGQGSKLHYENCVGHVTRAATVMVTRVPGHPPVPFGNIPLFDLKTTDADAVAEYLRDTVGLKPGSINRNLSAINTLLKWGKKRKYLSELPSFDFQDEPEHSPRLLRGDEDLQLLALLRTYGPVAEEVADYIEVDLDTGLRKAELLTRRPEHLSKIRVEINGKKQDRWFVLVEEVNDRGTTKGGEPRSVPLTDANVAILRKRLPWTIKKYNIRHYWNKARAELGLADDPRFVLHAVRHTFATRLVRANVNPLKIRDIMGHKDIKTTLRYVKIDNADNAAAQDALQAYNAERRKG